MNAISCNESRSSRQAVWLVAAAATPFSSVMLSIVSIADSPLRSGRQPFFIIANIFPIVGLEVQGISNATSLYGAVETIWKNDMEGVAALVFVTTILVPAMELSLMLYVLLPLKLGQMPQGLAQILRVLQSVRPWSMTQVFILGVLVALVKLQHLAHVVPGIALWSFGGLILTLTAAIASFNTHELWNMVREGE